VDKENGQVIGIDECSYCQIDASSPDEKCVGKKQHEPCQHVN
jgi:hypothetical protein